MAERDDLVLQNKPGDFEISATEGVAIEPIDLKSYIRMPEGASVTFLAELALGDGLPKGVSCSEDGILSGTPEKGTADELPYDILVVASSGNRQPLIFDLYLTIYPMKSLGIVLPEEESEAYLKAQREQMKKEYGIDLEQLDQFWALFSDDEGPDLTELLTRKVTPAEIYALLGRFATLTLWNSDDITPAVNGKIIEIEGASQHFLVYDFKVALITTPKDLYASDRTLEDALQTARAMVHEIQRRGWNIQLAGYDKMVTAAWVEANRLNSLGRGPAIKVEYFSPTPADQHVLKQSLGKTVRT